MSWAAHIMGWAGQSPVIKQSLVTASPCLIHSFIYYVDNLVGPRCQYFTGGETLFFAFTIYISAGRTFVSRQSPAAWWREHAVRPSLVWEAGGRRRREIEDVRENARQPFDMNPTIGRKKTPL